MDSEPKPMSFWRTVGASVVAHVLIVAVLASLMLVVGLTRGRRTLDVSGAH